MAENTNLQYETTINQTNTNKQEKTTAVTTRAQTNIKEALSDMDTITNFINKQKQDKHLKYLYNQIKRTGDNIISFGAEYTINNNILMAKSIKSKNKDFKYVAPSQLEQDIILQAHRLTHAGIKKNSRKHRKILHPKYP